MHLSLSGLGWLISLLEVGGGVFGFVISLALPRYGMRRFLLSGLAILSLASFAEAWASTTSILFVARGIEGFGYLLVIIAAPTAIAAAADDRARPRALALWSTFVPIGIAGGGGITALMLSGAGPHGVMLLWAIAIACTWPIAVRLPFSGRQEQRAVLPAPAAWVSAIAFGLYTVFISILTMLLPTLLIEQGKASIGAAATGAALASLAALPGSVIAIRLMRNGSLAMGTMITVSCLTLLATMPFLYFLYGDAATSFLASCTAALLAVAISGVVPPIMFARLPDLAGATRADDPRIAPANGLITQFGAGGALIGPPLGGAVVGIWGWNRLGVVTALLLLAMLVGVVASELIAAQRFRVPRAAR